MQTDKIKQLMYSVFSGTFYTILNKDLKHLGMGHIPLKKKPSESCKKCYGRGYLGRDQKTYTYNICNCIRKNIDFEILKSILPQDINNQF